MNANTVCASQVLSTDDSESTDGARRSGDRRPAFWQSVKVVVAHWVEYALRVLLFVMAPGDGRSGEFYVYDRKKGRFWLLSLADGVFGGYSAAEMRQKIREFHLLDLAENPGRLAPAR